MHAYKVLLYGENFQLKNEDGTVSLDDFYTHRLVNARNEEEAENKAVELIFADNDLRNCVVNPKDDPPMIYLVKMHQIRKVPRKAPNSGYTFFERGSQVAGDTALEIEQAAFDTY